MNVDQAQRAVLRHLRAGGLTIKAVEPWTHDEDADIELGGTHEGISVQLGGDEGGVYAIVSEWTSVDEMRHSGTYGMPADVAKVVEDVVRRRATS